MTLVQNVSIVKKGLGKIEQIISEVKPKSVVIYLSKFYQFIVENQYGSHISE